ncbi:putative BTB/POZ domain-containing protein 3 [Glarea lozoyensis 74030]|uniref:Putative BTB/POZ domain-containing protein 3 n=1 Tax=Glarea lozoyensis (strain ATCC 74030 / MF5533) TaxID=1104152 RepID=H0EKB3_GLAL7|nr:putative BTB/POZ domain-containing protein 3 [Glarea lozoyensis 74030]
MVFRKDELEIQLKDEHKMIQDGKIRDDSPLDVSDEFGALCRACRVGDLKGCQEAIAAGVNINARDSFDYTPLILDEVTAGRDQIERWYRSNVLKYKVEIDTSKAQDVKWTRDNGIFADVLLRADEESEEQTKSEEDTSKTRNTSGLLNGIPIGPAMSSRSPSTSRKPKKSVLFPVHRAMLIRSEYFQTMFSSEFMEAQATEYLQIILVDCSPEVLEIILNYVYTEKAENIPIDLAIDVLFAADMLFIEKLKTKAAIVISTIGNGPTSLVDRTHTENGEQEVEQINVYDVIRAGWLLKIQRLEEFSARYLAYRLEEYIDEEEFEELIKESAGRIEKRQETDTIELLDDIRYYLSERFRLRFEDSGLEDIMDEDGEINAEAVQAISDSAANDEAIDVEMPKLSKALGDLNVDNEQNPSQKDPASDPPMLPAGVRTLDGEIAGDEFAADAINYQVLLGKIDTLLERLKLDA